MILENLAHLLSKDHNNKKQEVIVTSPIDVDADKIRVTRNKFARLSREKRLS